MYRYDEFDAAFVKERDYEGLEGFIVARLMGKE